MGFNPTLLVKLQPSSLFTDPATIPNIAVSPAVPQSWLYNANLDTSATVLAAGYFNVFANDFISDSLLYQDGQNFRIGDEIYCVCQDLNVTIYVTAVTPTVTTLALPPGPLAVTTGDIVDGAVTNPKLASNAVTNVKVDAAAAIDFSKLAALTSAHILVGSAGNVATNTAVTGDVTISNTGVTAIGNNKVTNAMMDLNTIQYIQVPMTAAQWNGMYVAPFQILPALGAGLIYQVDNVWYDMAFVVAQYAAGGVVNLQYDSTANGAGVLVTQDVAAATIQGIAASSIVRPALATTVAANSTTVAKGLFMSNKTGAFTTGDGTWKINVAYRVITA